MKEKINTNESLVVKTNMIVFFVPIILFFPSLFTTFILIFVAFEHPLVLVSALPICLLITANGLLNLLQLVQFGLKKMIISSDYLIFFQWKVQKFSWKDIDDIQLKTSFDQEYLRLIRHNGKPIDIHLNGMQLNISSEYIYKIAIEKWCDFFEDENSYE